MLDGDGSLGVAAYVAQPRRGTSSSSGCGYGSVGSDPTIGLYEACAGALAVSTVAAAIVIAATQLVTLRTLSSLGRAGPDPPAGMPVGSLRPRSRANPVAIWNPQLNCPISTVGSGHRDQ